MAESGYFNAYGNVARKDNVDYVVHLGDYIYESADGVVGKDERATHPEHEIFSLYDYRARIGQVCCAFDLPGLLVIDYNALVVPYGCGPQQLSPELPLDSGLG